MDKNVYELLKDIDSHSNKISDWEEIINIFANAIKRKGLSKEQVHEINTKILKEVRKDKKKYKIVDSEEFR
jgi:hypothetical protein